MEEDIMETKSGMERMYEEATADDAERRAANIAFALASAYNRDGELDKAQVWAQQSVDLFGKIETRTLADVAPVFQRLGGTSFPDYIHGGVVARRFAHLGLAD